MSFCLLSILLVRCLGCYRWLLWGVSCVLKNWWTGRFLFHLTSSSHPELFSNKRYLHHSILKNQEDSSFVLWHILVQAVHPLLPYALSSWAIAEPSPASVLVASSLPNGAPSLTKKCNLSQKLNIFNLMNIKLNFIKIIFLFMY
jgi:hypothetical protein